MTANALQALQNNHLLSRLDGVEAVSTAYDDVYSGEIADDASRVGHPEAHLCSECGEALADGRSIEPDAHRAGRYFHKECRWRILNISFAIAGL